MLKYPLFHFARITLVNLDAAEKIDDSGLKELAIFQNNILLNLPWFYKLPLVALVISLGIFHRITTLIFGLRISDSCIQMLFNAPGFALVQKLLRTFCLMRTLDNIESHES